MKQLSVKRIRVLWPDHKGALRARWAYQIKNNPPQATAKLARAWAH